MIILTQNFIEGHEPFDALKPRVSGRFTFQAIKNGHVVREKSFDNLITNRGLDLWGSNNGGAVFPRIRVGTGTSVPAPSDTQLQTMIGVEIGATAGTTSPGVAPNYENTTTFTGNWAIGQVVGNLTEVSIGAVNSTNYAFSRALILDGAGVPTAFPIAADEQLRVTYVFKQWPPLVDQLTTQKIGSITYDVLVRAHNIATTSGGWAGYAQFSTPPQISTQQAFTGDAIASLTSSASPAGSLSNADSNTVTPYVTGSYESQGVTTAGPTTWNGNIRTILNRRATMGFQNQYTPAIAKTNLQTLIIPSKVAWSRH